MSKAGRLFINIAEAFGPTIVTKFPVAWREKVKKILYGPKPGGKIVNQSAIIQKYPLGINIIGYVRSEHGVGESARRCAAAVQAAGIDYTMYDFNVGNLSRTQDDSFADHISTTNPYRINLFHINADQTPVMVETLGRDFLDGHYNIGYWAWELPNFPDEWRNSFEFLDEIWVPSTFCQQAISAKANIPVLCVPHSIDIKPTVGVSRRQLGIPEGGFIFLYMFDVLSVPERKNPLAVLDAYSRAFEGKAKDVYLVLKISNLDRSPEFSSKLNSCIANDPSIIVIDQYFDRSHTNALVELSDCFISLHRSEGFGFGLAEAMSLGKPVIATGWSGNMDFMTQWNSIPVKYSLVTLTEDFGPYKKGQFWAEPDIDDAAESMLRVVSEKEFVAEVSLQAARTIRERFSPAAIGDKILSRINTLCGSINEGFNSH